VAQVIIENLYKQFPLGQGKPATGLAGTEMPLGTGQVLRAINLNVADGEFMVLVGPSGCGKSTLLRLIAGLEEITAGSIFVGDRRVNNIPPKGRDIAMVFQSYALYPHLTVYENIAFGLRRRSGQPLSLESLTRAMSTFLPRAWRYQSRQEKQLAQQVRAVAEGLQIDSLLERLPKQLSGGQKQRVALGRAIARNPQVFLMDEPLSNLDAQLRAETRSQIVKIQRQLGITTIYVTHDQTEAMTMGDRIAVLHQGAIQQIDSPLEIYNAPANRFVAQFIGSPPMNFLPAQVQGDLVLHCLGCPIPLTPPWANQVRAYIGQELDLGIRPEHFCLAPASPHHLAVEVDLVEALGHETFILVHPLTTPELSLQARLGPDQRVKLGDKLHLAITPDKIHLFNPQTGLSLRPSHSL